MVYSELDIAVERLRKALTPYAIERKLERERAYSLYIELAWEGKEGKHYASKACTNR